MAEFLHRRPSPNRGTVAFRFARIAALAFALSACQSRPAKDQPQVLRPGQPIPLKQLELNEHEERTARAHARFAAGLIEELDDAPEAALAHYLAALQDDPANEPLTLDVARKLIELQRLDQARLTLDTAAARPDASGLVWALLGAVHKLQNHTEDALAAQQEAIRRSPKNIGAFRSLAQIYLEAGQIPDAIVVLEQAAQQPDSDARFLLLLADALGALHQLKDPAVGDLKPRIVALLERAQSLQPTEPAEILRLADLFQLFGEGTRSLPLYQSLLESAPDLPGLRERLAEIYLRTDHPDKAAEQLRALALQRPTNPLPHYYLGVLALESKRFDEAVSAFNQVLILRPENEAIHYDLALANLSHNRAQQALDVLDQARKKFRTSFQLEFYSAVALSELKRYEDAIRHFTAAEVVAGATSPAQLTYLFYFQTGVAYERAKRYDDAAVQFEKAVELKPDFADALNYLGYMWAERGTNLERARELIQKAVDLEPDNGAFLDSLAWVLHQLGRSSEALPLQLRAIELIKEPDATLQDHLGDIYHKLGRTHEARQAWQRSLEIEAKPEVQIKLRDVTPP